LADVEGGKTFPFEVQNQSGQGQVTSFTPKEDSALLENWTQQRPGQKPGLRDRLGEMAGNAGALAGRLFKGGESFFLDYRETRPLALAEHQRVQNSQAVAARTGVRQLEQALNSVRGNREWACAVKNCSHDQWQEWEKRPEFAGLRARAIGTRVKYQVSRLETEENPAISKSLRWLLERTKSYENQFAAPALTIFEQNNYQLSEERARAIEARVQRLELEDSSITPPRS
jgi:hypothetical protein